MAIAFNSVEVISPSASSAAAGISVIVSLIAFDICRLIINEFASSKSVNICASTVLGSILEISLTEPKFESAKAMALNSAFVISPFVSSAPAGILVTAPLTALEIWTLTITESVASKSDKN